MDHHDRCVQRRGRVSPLLRHRHPGVKRLLHCPFCGEQERVRLYDASDDEPHANSRVRAFHVRCDACGCRGPLEISAVLGGKAKAIATDAAIDGWNLRISHDEDLVLRTTFALLP